MADKPVTLKQIASVTGAKLFGDESLEINDVTHNSRNATAGSLFVAVRGELTDAHKFIPQVLQQGAAGVISESAPPSGWQNASNPAAWLQVENVRRAMALAAAEVHQHPSRELKLVGITGTNGKTTTAYLVASIPEEAGEPVAMTGTVEYRLGAERKKADAQPRKLRHAAHAARSRESRLPNRGDGMLVAGNGLSSLRFA